MAGLVGSKGCVSVASAHSASQQYMRRVACLANVITNKPLMIRGKHRIIKSAQWLPLVVLWSLFFLFEFIRAFFFNPRQNIK